MGTRQPPSGSVARGSGGAPPVVQAVIMHEGDQQFTRGYAESLIPPLKMQPGEAVAALLHGGGAERWA